MEDIPEFDLIAWSTDHSLKRRTTDALSRQDYSNKEVLLLMMPGDVAALDITGGQARLLRKALEELGNLAFKATDDGVQRDESQRGDQPGRNDPRPDSEVDPGEALPRHIGDAGRNSHEEVLRAGEALDRILRDSTASLQPAIVDGVRPVVGSACTATGLPMAMGEGYDPHMVLTIRATTRKALQVRDFVPDQVRQRLAKKKRETLRWVEAADGSFSIQADDQAPAYLTQAEWGAANMRIMSHLIKVGDLQRLRVEEYMAYTVIVHELASRYDWASVLEFDVRYREQQAEHGFRWGTPARHLESLLLQPKRREQQAAQFPQARASQRGKHGSGGSAGRSVNSQGQQQRPGAYEASTEPCRLFMTKGTCSFGDKCRYSHVNSA